MTTTTTHLTITEHYAIFDDCHDEGFVNLDLSNKAIYGRIDDCGFMNCDFTNARFDRVLIDEVSFYECNLTNARLDTCDMNRVRVGECNIAGAAFPQFADIKQIDCTGEPAHMYKQKYMWATIDDIFVQVARDFIMVENSVISHPNFDEYGLLSSDGRMDEHIDRETVVKISRFITECQVEFNLAHPFTRANGDTVYVKKSGFVEIPGVGVYKLGDRRINVYALYKGGAK